MKRIFILLTILLISTNWCQAKHLYKEAQYRDYWCGKQGGITEYRLKTGERVDCLLPDYAVELDFARKHKECVGQAVEYAAALNKNPKCVLILENPDEKKYVNIMRYRIQTKYKQRYPGWEFSTATIKLEQLEKYLNINK